jgi:hypothetical protein
MSSQYWFTALGAVIEQGAPGRADGLATLEAGRAANAAATVAAA